MLHLFLTLALVCVVEGNLIENTGWRQGVTPGQSCSDFCPISVFQGGYTCANRHVWVKSEAEWKTANNAIQKAALPYRSCSSYSGIQNGANGAAQAAPSWNSNGVCKYLLPDPVPGNPNQDYSLAWVTCNTDYSNTARLCCCIKSGENAQSQCPLSAADCAAAGDGTVWDAANGWCVAPPPTTAPTTGAPTSAPTGAPSSAPTTGAPTTLPTSAPTAAPTAAPTGAPTSAPTSAPTGAPTSKPTSAPTSTPTSAPTGAPIAAPVASPVAAVAPVAAPVASPSAARPGGVDDEEFDSGVGGLTVPGGARHSAWWALLVAGWVAFVC